MRRAPAIWVNGIEFDIVSLVATTNSEDKKEKKFLKLVFTCKICYVI